MTDKLERALRLRDLILIVIGTVIGSGIFIVPATVLDQTGRSAGIAMLVWLLGGVLSLLGALTYAELGAMFPEAGGIYVYLREAFGRMPAFLYGWTLFFVIGSASVATLSVAFSSYLNQLIPLSPFADRLISILMILVVATINVIGVKRSARVQNWTTGIKVGAILVMSIVLVTKGDKLSLSFSSLVPDSFSSDLFSGIGIAVVGVLWAYEGWHYVTFSTGETVEPQRSFARAIILGTIALIGIYIFANIAYIAALGTERASQSNRIASEAVGSIMGSTAGNLIAVAILISMFSAANGITLTATRVYYAMAYDGIFFQKLAEVHPRFKTPSFAIIWSSVCAMLFAATGTFDQLLTYVVFAGWIFYALGASSIFVFRRNLATVHRPFKVPGYPATPLLFILASSAIFFNTLISQPERGLVGLGIVLLGTPAFYLWKGRSKKPSLAENKG